MSSVAVNTSLNVNIDFELAGVDKRIYAWTIDFAIRLLYLYFASSLFEPAYANSTAYILFVLAIYLPILFYFLLFEMLLNGQTPGKMLFKIKVISLTGYKPSYIQYLNRWIFRLMDTGFITIIFFGFIGSWVYGIIFLIGNVASLIHIIASKKEQRVGDVIANTTVIRLKPKTSINDTIFTSIEDTNYKVTYPNVIKLSDRDISVIKNALDNADKWKKYERLESIAYKLAPIVNAPYNEDPYYLLTTIIRDYNYLTTRS